MSYYTNLIPDFGLTADQLDDKYNQDGGGEHPVAGFQRWDWRSAVAQQATISSYCAWLKHKLDEAQDELDRDSPYNQTGE